MHAVKAGSGGTGDVQIAFGAKGQMVRRDGRFQRGEHVNLSRAADLEHSSAAVAHIQILFFVERDAGGHTHTFHIHGHVSGGRDLVDDAVVTAGNVEQTFFVKGQPVGFIRSVTNGLDVKPVSTL